MDFSRMSDAELLRIAGGGSSRPAAPDFSKMSDAELERIANSSATVRKEPNPFDQFDPPAEKNPFDQFDEPAKPWERFKNETGPAPWEQFAGEKGEPAPAGNSSTLAALAGAYGRVQGLGARTAIGEGTKGVLSLGTLPVDALVNAGYGAHKLAAKTGLVSEPDADFYYGKGKGYFPATSGIGEAVDEGLDKVAAAVPKVGGYLRAPETPAERMATAIGGGAIGALSGAGAARLIPGAVGGFLAARPGLQAAAGAASGGASQGVQELGGDATAATVAGLAAGAATGAAGARVTRPRAAPVPTTADLRDAKSAAYARSEAAGVEFTGDAVRQLHRDVRDALPGEGIFLNTDPKARSVMAPLEQAPFLGNTRATAGTPNAVSLERMDDIRQQAGKLSRSLDPGERRTGAVLARHVDDFLDNVTPAQLTRSSGDAAEGIGALREGQAANRRYAKASALDVALDKAELRADASGSGMNGQNTVKQNLRRIIEDPNSRAFRQFDEPERAAMRRIVEGDLLTNSLRLVGKAAPTGGVSGAVGAGAYLTGNGWYPAVGLAAKYTGEAIQRGRVRQLEDLVRGGPGAGQRPSARVGANAARGAFRGFLAGPSEMQGNRRYQ